MQRPASVSAASWIWMLSALFTTFTVANILTATEVLVVSADMPGGPTDLPSAVVISWFGWLLAGSMLLAMAAQVVAAVKLRDGESWPRIVLSVVAFFSVVGVLMDITMVSAWLLLAAHVVAMVLTFGQSASEFLTPRVRETVPA